MKKRFRLLMLATMLCLCIIAAGLSAYAEDGDSIQDSAFPNDAKWDMWGLTAPPSDDTNTIMLGSKKARSSEITPIDTEFTSADNKRLRLAMTGLTAANTDSMLTALETSFLDSGEGSDTPIKVVNESFIDAEKWDCLTESYDDHFFGYDALHCWAGSCSNMLWLSGWIVSRDSDGSAVASGSTGQLFNVPAGIEVGAMLYLNKTGSGYAKWQPGAYTVTLSFNKNRNIREAYYKNNFDRSLHFTVTEEAAPEKDDDSSQDDDNSQNTAKPEKDNVEPKSGDNSQNGSEPRSENIKKPESSTKGSVKTGDETRLALWLLTAVLTAAGSVFLMIVKIRRTIRSH